MLKLVGSDTLEAFGRQLVALHRPAKVDWAARFGIAAASARRRVEATPARRPWLVKYDGPCSNCGTMLPKGTEAIWRQTRATDALPRLRSGVIDGPALAALFCSQVRTGGRG